VKRRAREVFSPRWFGFGQVVGGSNPSAPTKFFSPLDHGALQSPELATRSFPVWLVPYEPAPVAIDIDPRNT